MEDLNTENQQPEPIDPVEQVDNLFSSLDEKGEIQEPKKEEEVIEPEEQEEIEAEEEEEIVEDEKGIDYDLEVPLQSGEKVKLGVLKDHFQEQAERLVEITDRELKVSQNLAKQKELAEYLQVVPPEVQQKAMQEIHNNSEAEFTALTDAIPAWKDEGAFKLGKTAIYDIAGEYGVQDIVAQVQDHRVIKMIYDFQQLRAAVKSAKDKVKPVKKKKPVQKRKPQATDKQNSLIDKAKQSGARQDQISAISSLLG